MWQKIRAGRQSPRRRWELAGLPVAVAAVAAVWLLWPLDPSAPPTSATPSAAAARWAVPEAFDVSADASAERFELDDGSSIELAPGSRLTTIEAGEARFVTLLERGRATFEVVPGGPRRWVVESGLATIEVVGTAFEVHREASRVRVLVRRGVVLVRGERVPERVARLVAGDSLVVEDRSSGRAEMGSRSGAAGETVGVGETVGAGEGVGETVGETVGVGGTVGVGETAGVRAGRARRAAREDPPADVGALVARASAARREGRAREAAALLQRASAQDDPRAALAAFTLGRIEMDELHRRGRARRALRRALALGLPGRMAQQAERRLHELRR